MNEETFERRLSRQPLRPVPVDWRADILRAAREAQADAKAPAREISAAGWLSIFTWPPSRAWAGLAAVWVLIAAVHFSVRDTAPSPMARVQTPTPDAIIELHNQQRLLAELSGQNQPADADRPKNVPSKPHSARTELRTI